MWRNYLDEEEANGSLIKVTRRTLEYFERVFDMYLDPQVPDFEGVILLASVSPEENTSSLPHLDVGCLMWGDVTLPYDLHASRPASGWGVYVAPKWRRQGVSQALREAGKSKMRDLGFDLVFGSALADSEDAVGSSEKAGWVFYSRQGYIKL